MSQALAGERREGLAGVEHHDDVVDVRRAGRPSASRRPVVMWTGRADPVERDAVPGGERGDAADAGDDLESNADRAAGVDLLRTARVLS